jgi:hypothetical protein
VRCDYLIAIITYLEIRTIEEVKSRRKRVDAEKLPRFLFPDGQILDEEDPEDGLFRGHVIIRVR